MRISLSSHRCGEPPGDLGTVIAILAIDLGVLHSEAHEPSFRESAVLAGSCMALGFGFSVIVWWLYYTGTAASLDPNISAAATPVERAWTAWELYLTGWVVEQTLAFDNVFVMSMIFTYFAIPPKHQHRVLFYGILGVIVLRAVTSGLRSLHSTNRVSHGSVGRQSIS